MNFEFTYGKHVNISDGMCVMEALDLMDKIRKDPASLSSDMKVSDFPSCVDSEIRHFMIGWNDGLGISLKANQLRKQYFLPLMLEMLDTNTGKEDQSLRRELWRKWVFNF